jgi:hypothetical protein
MYRVFSVHDRGNMRERQRDKKVSVSSSPLPFRPINQAIKQLQ